MSFTSHIARLLPLALLMAAAGLALLVAGWHWLQQDRELEKWPTTPGTLVSSRIEQCELARLESHTRYSTPTPDGNYRRDPVWALGVSYKYVVAGRSYAGERAASHELFEELADHPAPSERLKALHAALVPGPVQVHHHPADPQRSYLLFVANPTPRRALAYGGGCLVLGLLVAGMSLVARNA